MGQQPRPTFIPDFIPDQETFIPDQPEQEEDEPVYDTEEQPGILSHIWHGAFDPLTNYPSQQAKKLSRWIDPEQGGRGAKAITSAYIESLGGIGDALTSPISAALGVLTGGSSLAARAALPTAARAATYGVRGLSAPVAAHGLYGMTQAEDVPQFVVSALEAAGGGLGVRTGVPSVRSPRLPTPEVLPPEVPRPQLQLGEGNLIGGPGGVERAGLIRPQDVIELQGSDYTMMGEPSTPAGSVLDIDALRESERLKNVFYTQHEQPGLGETLGTRLDAPETTPGYTANDVAEALRAQEQANLAETARRQAEYPDLMPEVEALDNSPEAALERAIAEQRKEQMVRAELEAMRQPPVTGETRLGFEGQSRAGQQLDDILGEPQAVPDMGYPYNVVPERLRPRTNQTVTEALAPERYSDPIPPESGGGIEMGTAEAPPPRGRSFWDESEVAGDMPDMRGGTAALTPDEPILPSAPPKWRTPPHTQEASRTAPDSTAAHVAENVEPAVPGASEAVAPIIEQNRGTLGKAAEGVMVSIEKQFERMGPIGQAIRRVLSGAQYRKRELYNKWAEPYIKATKGMDEMERKNFVAVMDATPTMIKGKVQRPVPITERVANAVAVARGITNEMAKMAETAGVRLKTVAGEIVPFKGIEDYWPRRPKNPMNQNRFIDEMIKNNPKLTRARALELVQKMMDESEFFNSPQHSRAATSFEWRDDLSAMTDHIGDMSDIIARAEHLGPGDIGRPGSIITKLLDQTPNPVESARLARTHLRGGMDTANDTYRAWKRVNAAVTKWQVMTKLGGFPMSVLNQQLPTLMHGTIPQFAQAFMRATFGSSTLKNIAKNYGTRSIGDVPIEMMSEMGKVSRAPFVGDVVRWTENFSRTVATGAGMGSAKSFFKAAKAGDKMAAAKLKDLLLHDDIGEVLKQESLNPEQLKFATQRFVELTQQLNSNMKLPPMWTTETMLQIPLIFKKFAFQGTKSIKDAIMMDPKRNIPLFLIASPIIGELTGDLKATVYGVIRGAPAPDGMLEAIAHEVGVRQNYMGQLTGFDNEDDVGWLVNRIATDYIQSWGMGLVGDALQGILGGKDRGMSALLGPGIEQFFNVGYYGSQMGLGAMRADEEQFISGATGLGRESLRSIPFIGPGLQRRLLPTENQEIP